MKSEMKSHLKNQLTNISDFSVLVSFDYYIITPSPPQKKVLILVMTKKSFFWLCDFNLF